MHRDVIPIRAAEGDRGDIVLGWLTKLTLTLAVFGMLLFDLISLGVGRFQTEDRAATAARAAVRAYAATPDVQAAYAAALDSLVEAGSTDAEIDPGTFRVDPASGSVTLTVHQTSSTMLLEKIGPLRHWADVAATTTVRRSG